MPAFDEESVEMILSDVIREIFMTFNRIVTYNKYIEEKMHSQGACDKVSKVLKEAKKQ